MIDNNRPKPQGSNAHHERGTATRVGMADVKPAFRPPEVVAQEDQQKHNTNTPSYHESAKTTAVTGSGGKKHWWHKLSKKQWIIISAVAVVLIGGGVASYFVWFHNSAKPVAVHKTVKRVAPKLKPVPLVSTLTGLPIADAGINTKQVTAVMVENSIDARPQSGLDKAGVVFEAVAEGGITRFVALYQDTSTDYIGPVRSIRPYYLSWLQGFGAAVAHVGGSGEALADVKSWNIKNLDQEYNSSFFTRITSRYSPHNVYTSIANLNTLEAKLGYTSSTYTGFTRKAEAPSAAPTATSINLAVSGYDYNVHYDYNAATNSYNRSEGGAPHMVQDQNGVKTQLSPKVVVALVTSQSLEADHLHNQYTTVGSGTIEVFQDGVVTPGTWSKDSNNGPLKFLDNAGKPLALDPGQTWITALGSSNLVTYK